MSIDIIPLRVWQENTLQNHIPANDNALRQEAMVRPCLGVANDEAGGDQDGDVWIVGDTPTGAFSSFDANDVAMLRQGNWYAWKPFEGMRLVVAGVRKVFDSGAWVDDPSVGGGGSGDVVGPASAVDNRIAVFDGTTGKLLKDGGVTVADLVDQARVSPENVQTGTTYTLVLADAFKLVAMNNAAANTLTVPPNSTVAFPVGTRIDLSQDGAGQTTIAAGSGVTIRTPETLKIRKRYGKATLIKRATDTWDLEGNLEAAP